MKLIDTHCHLNDDKAFADPGQAVAEARQAGVETLIVVAVDNSWSRAAVDLAEKHEEVFAVVGWHPSHSADYRPEDLEVIRALAAHPKAVAIGEIGFDFYWKHATREQQEACLDDHMNLAEELGMPVVFHCRDAYPDLLTVLETRRPGVPMLFHCFSGSSEDAARAMALDCWFGFDGPITYPKNEALRDILRSVPRDRILLETDAPWMSPVPHRGKRNQPSWLVHINSAAAQALSLTDEECAALTTANAEAFFRLPSA